MEAANENIDELLSGKLDGMLPAFYAEQLAILMVKDPSLKRRLDDIATARRLLASGRPT